MNNPKYLVIEIDKHYNDPLISLKGTYNSMDNAIKAKDSYVNLADVNKKPKLVYTISAIAYE